MTVFKKLFGLQKPIKICEQTLEYELAKAELELKVYRKNLISYVVEIITGTRPDKPYTSLRTLGYGLTYLIDEKLQSGALKDLIEANRENRNDVLPLTEAIATDSKHFTKIYTAAIRNIAKDYMNWVERDLGIDFSPEQYARLIEIIQREEKQYTPDNEE